MEAEGLTCQEACQATISKSFVGLVLNGHGIFTGHWMILDSNHLVGVTSGLLMVVDISDPASGQIVFLDRLPELQGTSPEWTTPELGRGTTPVVVGKALYVVIHHAVGGQNPYFPDSVEQYLWVYDLSDPSAPVKTAELGGPQDGYAGFLDIVPYGGTGHVFLQTETGDQYDAPGDATSAKEIIDLDVSDPTAPQEAGRFFYQEFHEDESPHRFVQVDNYLWGLPFWDESPSSNPDDWDKGVPVLPIIDVSDPTSMTLVKVVTPFYLNAMDDYPMRKDGVLLMAKTLQALDATDPLNPRVLSDRFEDTFGDYAVTCVAGDFALAQLVVGTENDPRPSYEIINVSNPAHPVRISTSEDITGVVPAGSCVGQENHFFVHPRRQTSLFTLTVDCK